MWTLCIDELVDAGSGTLLSNDVQNLAIPTPIIVLSVVHRTPRFVGTFGSFEDRATIKAVTFGLQRRWINSKRKDHSVGYHVSKIIAAGTAPESKNASATQILVLVGWLRFA